MAAGQQANPYLSPNQQDLLLAALSSQAKKPRSSATAVGDTGLAKRTTSDDIKDDPAMMTAMFQSPATMDLNTDFTPELDYLDGDTSFDFDNADLGGEMIGALPGSGAEPEQHDKRKSPDENEEPEEGDAKRQETLDGEKGAKKPGRKPLTNEPTTVSQHHFAIAEPCRKETNAMLHMLHACASTNEALVYIYIYEMRRHSH